jgi:beta-ribofuranosylaminobenzene 5'-phosphate synthase
MSLLNEVKELEKIYTLTPMQRALLISNGSTTTLLEAFTGKEVKVKGREQRIIMADSTLARELKVEQSSKISKRTVQLINDESSTTLAYAISYTPIERISGGLRSDIQSTDIPIGKILKRYKMESRREIKKVGFCRDAKFNEIFGSECCFYRSYLIIHNNSPLMKIEEYFPLNTGEHYE